MVKIYGKLHGTKTLFMLKRGREIAFRSRIMFRMFCTDCN